MNAMTFLKTFIFYFIYFKLALNVAFNWRKKKLPLFKYNKLLYELTKSDCKKCYEG